MTIICAGSAGSSTAVTQIVVVSSVGEVDVIDATNSYDVADEGEVKDASHGDLNKDIGGIQGTRTQ